MNEKILLIAGPSGSGKTTLALYLDQAFGYRRVVTYTSRPMRKGEKDGIDYHFLTDEEFLRRKALGFFLETAVYRGWHYGTGEADLSEHEKCCCVLTPSGIRRAKAVYPDANVIYLNPGRKECLLRLLYRGDDIDEAYRRNLTDVGQFDGFEWEADLSITENLPPDDLFKEVEEFLKK